MKFFPHQKAGPPSETTEAMLKPRWAVILSLLAIAASVLGSEVILRCLPPKPLLILAVFVALTWLPCLVLLVCRFRWREVLSARALCLEWPVSRRTRFCVGAILLGYVLLAVEAMIELKYDPTVVAIIRDYPQRMASFVFAAYGRQEVMAYVWLGLVLFSRCILAPIFEELFFRVLVFKSLAAHGRTLLAFLVAGVLFFFYHDAVWCMGYNGKWLLDRLLVTLANTVVVHTIGCVSLLYCRSIFPAIVFHAGWNCMVTVAEVLRYHL